MTNIKVGFKRIYTYAELPKYAHVGDAGMDTFLPCDYRPLSPGEIRIIPLGFSVEIPEGYELQVRSRSGLASRGISVANSPGTIDSGYRGEVGVILQNHSPAIQPLNKGDRIAQLVLSEVPICEWEVLDEFEVKTERGDGGFGSSKGYTIVEEE